MNHENEKPSCCNLRTVAAVIGILGSFLIIAVLVTVMKKHTDAPPINQARAEERSKALKDVRAAESAALKDYAWRDQAKGFIRIPIDDGKQIFLREWQNPAAARSNLNARADAFAAPLPEKKSDFE